MAKIKELTPEQEADLIVCREEYLKIGLCTDPADKPRAEAAFARAYGVIGRKPVKTVWVSSPHEASHLVERTLRPKTYDKLVKQGKVPPLSTNLWGQQDYYWIGLYLFGRKIGVKYDDKSNDYLDIMAEIGQSCMWWWPYNGAVIACDRPCKTTFDPDMRLHCEDGPAVLFRDGFAIYSFHGVRVPAWIIEKPQDITVAKIDAEDNAEIRRVMITKYGTARYMKDAGGVLVHSLPDDFKLKGLRGAKLWRRDVPNDVPIVMIEVLNSTPEPDGSIKIYHLRVDPDAYDGMAGKDCHAAMASTWRNEDRSLFFRRHTDYAPEIET